MSTETYYGSYENEKVLPLLIGKRVVAVDFPSITLSDGTRLTFDTENDDCCSTVDLTALAKVENIITDAKFVDNEEETGGEGEYKAALFVVTEAGELNLAEADGDASNGYYLHGFALGVTVARGDASQPADGLVPATSGPATIYGEPTSRGTNMTTLEAENARYAAVKDHPTAGLILEALHEQDAHTYNGNSGDILTLAEQTAERIEKVVRRDERHRIAALLEAHSSTLVDPDTTPTGLLGTINFLLRLDHDAPTARYEPSAKDAE